ncbi:MAG TPA: enoyl-CoA hydratase/isomerase family protein [Terriglobales bacterium]|jgi:cyclohexa-1,5-dienecarbonyl-CoA hydratase|nr:enoyl-CoA hydratase/isomerase family protein [Terriglobales bacterium]
MPDSQSTRRIQLLSEPPFARVLLTHGKQNVIDVQMMEELAQALADIESESDISTIILSGVGEHFSAGVDIPSHTPDKAGEMLGKFHEVIRRLVRTTKVTLAVVRGYCLGGGAELAMVCDIVVTAESAHWGFPEIQLGCYPPVAAAALAAIVGQKRAAELVLTGRTFYGKEAAQLGLANRAVSIKLAEAVLDYEQRLKVLSPTALAHAKRALYSWDAAHFEKGLARAEDIYLKELIQTEDAREGILAWMEKRKPQWKGK